MQYRTFSSLDIRDKFITIAVPVVSVEGNIPFGHPDTPVMMKISSNTAVRIDSGEIIKGFEYMAQFEGNEGLYIKVSI